MAGLRKTAQGKKAPSQRPKIPVDNGNCDEAPGRHFFKEQIEGRAWIIISERCWRWREAQTLDALRCNLSRAPPSSRRPNVLLGRWHQTREPSHQVRRMYRSLGRRGAHGLAPSFEWSWLTDSVKWQRSALAWQDISVGWLGGRCYGAGDWSASDGNEGRGGSTGGALESGRAGRSRVNTGIAILPAPSSGCKTWALDDALVEFIRVELKEGRRALGRNPYLVPLLLGWHGVALQADGDPSPSGGRRHVTRAKRSVSKVESWSLSLEGGDGTAQAVLSELRVGGVLVRGEEEGARERRAIWAELEIPKADSNRFLNIPPLGHH
ncbi:hypothetical protein BJ912DRAFT_923326 [Pholiota molesta]|nr:hypothetical protein BJ912DRAFT_923326 [Pholiota molesta]